jgi:uroporphyrinogen decarboxylase
MSNNSLKRVLDALALKQSDLIPFHAYESPEHVMAQAGRMVHEMYLEPESFIEAMIHCSHLYHNDIVAMRNDPFLLIEALTHKYECTEYGDFEDFKFSEKGNELIIIRKSNNNVAGKVLFNTKTVIPAETPVPLVQSPKDIEKIEIVSSKILLARRQYKMLKRYVEEFKGKRFLLAGIGGASANILDMTMGTENAMIATLTDKGLCKAIFDRHFEVLKQRILALTEIGVDGIVTGDACASCSFYSPETYNELFFYAQKRVVDFIHECGLKALLHICGRISPILERMADTGADMIESLDMKSAGGDIDLADAKKRIGDRICLKGNIDAVHIIEPGPSERVYNECIEAMKKAGPNGYILSTEQITRDTPRENVLAMVNARNDYCSSVTHSERLLD